MTSTELPPVNFGGGLRLSIFSPRVVKHLEEIETKIEPTITIQEDDTDACHDEEEHPLELDAPKAANIPIHPAPSLQEAHLESLDDATSHHEEEHPAEINAPTPPPALENIPIHPIPSLQEAFSESLDEATNGSTADKPKLRELDAHGRRQALIAQERDEVPLDFKWRFRDGQKQHELAKLIAQISFGVYLLFQDMANSNAQVVTILQGHIDEVDEFLEVVLEDLAEATKDLNSRIEHLKLPLANVQVFEQLLEDRNFRLEILQGNEKIDHVLSRTNAALNQWDRDIDAGIQSTAAFVSWLKDEEDAEWREERPGVADVLDAMKGNAEGWLNAFDDMSDRVQEASNLIMRLSTIIGEMEKKAGEVSRRTWANIPPFTLPSSVYQDASSSHPVSIKSGTSSAQSTCRSSHWPHASIRSAGVSATTESIADINIEEDFPLPGGLPLLPPSRSLSRCGPDGHPSPQKPATRAHSRLTSRSKRGLKDQDLEPQSSLPREEPLYVLQPHTYTPQSSESNPSPKLKQTATFHEPNNFSTERKKTLGIRSLELQTTNAYSPKSASSKSVPPDAIRAPPRPFVEEPSRSRSPKAASPRTNRSNPFDSAPSSDGESFMQSGLSHVDSEMGASTSRRPHLTHSSRSDHPQLYHPVRASPHSPLQQRLDTAVAARPHSDMGLRHQPSAIGGMSTLGIVANAVHNGDARSQVSETRIAGNRTLKKKKSAFGWFKKAFSLDEEERAAFEARKAMQHEGVYYDPNSPKFLDGRRIR
ncbi:uncharacterized protein UV8b_01150 [Ustilaginoidea virens]|uniref:Karyogamy protein n=1 Tax=Ustilaginoidea virens TaxID=1159556 RepID=A0A8E5HK16_USTVR|nr:uncharacterized protein UV8b_01150 [Ustilaginoidea virens]QUC16909.1 hypothetical protein UV8b_01150 [Ustilaginoidea virens]